MIVTRPAILERPVDDVTRERPKSYRVRRAGFVLVLLDVEPPDEQVVPRLAPIPPAGEGVVVFKVRVRLFSRDGREDGGAPKAAYEASYDAVPFASGLRIEMRDVI